MYRGWTQTDYQNKHYKVKQKDKGTLDDRGRDGGTNFILRIKEQETHLTLYEHDDHEDNNDNDDDYDDYQLRHLSPSVFLFMFLSLSAWKDSAPTRRILMKFDVLVFF